MPEFTHYYWGSIERVRCPLPCNRDHATEAEAETCYESCPKHPKPVARVSQIVGPTGEDVVVVEQPEPIVLAPKRSKKHEADATGEP